MPLVTDRVRNHATYHALRHATTHDEVRRIFGAGLNEATGHKVHLYMDDQVDLYAARQLAMNSLVMLRHYRVTDLREVTVGELAEPAKTENIGAIKANETPAAVFESSRSVWERTGKTGSRLWFNSRLFSTAAGESYAEHLSQSAQKNKVNRSGRLGIASLVAHEIGHLIGSASRKAAAERGRRDSLAHEVIRQAANNPASHRITHQVAEKYKAERKFFAHAQDEEIRDWHRRDLEKYGFPQDATLNQPVANIRNERLAALPGEYYGRAPVNELSKALVKKHSGGYAGTNLLEQEGESTMAVVVDGAQADMASKATHAFAMHNLGRPANDRPRDFHKYNNLIVVDNRTQKAEAERASNQRANESKPHNPWLNTTPTSPSTAGATGGDPKIPPMPDRAPDVHLKPNAAAAGGGPQVPPLPDRAPDVHLKPNAAAPDGDPKIPPVPDRAPDVHLKQQSGHAQTPPPHQSGGPGVTPAPPAPGPRPSAAGLTPMPPTTAAPTPQRQPGPASGQGTGMDVGRTRPVGPGRAPQNGRSLPGPGGGVRP